MSASDANRNVRPRLKSEAELAFDESIRQCEGTGLGLEESHVTRIFSATASSCQMLMQTYNISLQTYNFSLHGDAAKLSAVPWHIGGSVVVTAVDSKWAAANPKLLYRKLWYSELWFQSFGFASGIELANKRAIARQTYSFRQCEGSGLGLEEPLERDPTKYSFMRIWLPQELQRLIFYWHFRNEDYYYPDEEFFFPFLGGGPLGTTAGLTAGGRWLTRQEAADLDEEYDLGYAAERYTHVRLRRRADYYPDEECYYSYYYYEDDDGRCDYVSSDDDYNRGASSGDDY